MTNSLSERIIKNILATFLLSGAISFIMQLLWVLCFSKLNDSFAENIFNIWMIFVFSIGMCAFFVNFYFNYSFTKSNRSNKRGLYFQNFDFFHYSNSYVIIFFVGRKFYDIKHCNFLLRKRIFFL